RLLQRDRRIEGGRAFVQRAVERAFVDRFPDDVHPPLAQDGGPMFRVFGRIHRFERGDRVRAEIVGVRVDGHRVVPTTVLNASVPVRDGANRAAGVAVVLNNGTAT